MLLLIFAGAPQADVGTSAGTFGRLAGASTGSQSDPGAAAGTFGRLSGSSSGSQSLAGSSAASLGRLSGASSGSQSNPGTSAGSFGRLAGSSTSAPGNPGTSAAAFARLAGTSAGTQSDPAASAAAFGRIAGSSSGSQANLGTSAALLGRLIGASSGTSTASGSIPRVPRRRILLRLAAVATTAPAGPLPADLAAAIVARFDADPTLSGPGAFAAIYRDEAGQRLPDGPYLVFEIRRGSLVYQSSDSKWHDDRVKFVAWSDSGATANDLAEGPVLAAFDGAALSHARGVTTPFVEADRGQGRSPGRSAGGKMGYWASIEFSVRSRTGRPE